MDTSAKIQIVINTIQGLDIKASFDNVNHMMGILKTLAAIRDELQTCDLKEVTNDAGKADAE